MTEMEEVMMETIILEDFPGGRIIKLNRPRGLNALNKRMADEMQDAVDAAKNDHSVRCLVFIGATNCFCAGADIKELTDVKSSQDAKNFSGRYQTLFKNIMTFPKPTIAAVNRFALGGGFELAISCDIIIAAKNTKFGVPEINLGALPAGGGTVRLPALVGDKVAKQMLFFGEPMETEKMFELGVVNMIVDEEELLPRAVALGERLGAQSIEAIIEIKKLLRRVDQFNVAEAMSAENETFAMLWAGGDLREGVSSFIEKRKPVFNRHI